LIQAAKVAGSAVIGIFHDPVVRDAVADHCLEVSPLVSL
jgi:alpha-D-ribose 1-methylphosphonate 5-triphosphate synthase subunit PhnL